MKFSPAFLQPSRRSLLAALAGGLALSSPLARASIAGVIDGDKTLTEVLTTAWEGRYAGKDGGLTMVVQGKDQRVFASTLPDVTPRSFFRGASITKTFTAASIMLLDEQGKLRIDDRISDLIPGRHDPYLPEGSGFAIPHRDQITIRQLLCHRAGVFDLANTAVPKDMPFPYAGLKYTDWKKEQEPTHSFTPDELIGVIAETQLTHSAPGAEQHYSDTHYTLLERIVQNVSGQPRDDFKISRFLEPMGLANTRFVLDGSDWTLPEPAIPGFTLASEGVFRTQDYNYSYDPGSGNLVTTPEDLVTWMRRLISGEAGVSAQQIARMTAFEPGFPGKPYGLGILGKWCNGVFLGYGHNGGTAGYITDALHNPETGISYVLQCSLLDWAGGIFEELDWLGVVATDALKKLSLI